MFAALPLLIVGLVWATPGALPPAADKVVRFGRIATGAGMVVAALGMMLRDFMVTEGGCLVIAIGLGATAWAIHVQTCDRK